MTVINSYSPPYYNFSSPKTTSTQSPEKQVLTPSTDFPMDTRPKVVDSKQIIEKPGPDICIYPKDPNLNKPKELEEHAIISNDGLISVLPSDPDQIEPFEPIKGKPFNVNEKPIDDSTCIYPPNPNLKLDELNPKEPKQYQELPLQDDNSYVVPPASDIENKISTNTLKKEAPIPSHPKTFIATEEKNAAQVASNPKDNLESRPKLTSDKKDESQISFKPIFKYGSFIGKPSFKNQNIGTRTDQNSLAQNILDVNSSKTDKALQNYAPISFLL